MPAPVGLGDGVRYFGFGDGVRYFGFAISVAGALACGAGSDDPRALGDGEGGGAGERAGGSSEREGEGEGGEGEEPAARLQRCSDAALPHSVATVALPGRGMGVAWSPAGDEVAVGGHFRDPETRLRYDTRVVDVAAGAVDRSYACHYYWVNAVAWKPGAIADGGYDHAVRLWDPAGPGSTTCEPGQNEPEEGAIAALREIDGAVTSLSFSPDGTLLAAASRDAIVRVWDLAPGPRQHRVVWMMHDEDAGNVLSVQFSPDGGALVTGDRGRERVAVWEFDRAALWDDATVEEFAGVGYEAQGNWARNHPEATARTPRWGAETGDWVWTTRWAPSGDRVAAAVRDGRLLVLDAATGAPLVDEELAGARSAAGLDWSPDGARIAVGGGDGRVHVWDVEASAWAGAAEGHADLVAGVAFSPDGCSIATTAGGPMISQETHEAVDGPDTTMRIWSFDPEEEEGGGDDPIAPDPEQPDDPADPGDPEDPADPVEPGDPDPPLPPEGDEAYEGFGAETRGGEGGTVIRVEDATEDAVRDAFEAANDGDAIVVFAVDAPIAIEEPLPRLTGGNVTIEGGGATLVGDGFPAGAALVDVRGHDVIVRDLRLRNGGDNLRVQGDGASRVVIAHVSSTGAYDDGISIGYGATQVTVQYAFLAGNTRSIFIKEGGTTDVSIHHTWIQKQWIRGPLVSTGAFVDLRNVIVEDWTMWGSRVEADATANVVSSLWRLSDAATDAGGRGDSALRDTSSGDVWVDDLGFEGAADPFDFEGAAGPFDAPAVTTLSLEAMEPHVVANAGCLPRDSIDQSYIDWPAGWDLSDGSPLR